MIIKSPIDLELTQISGQTSQPPGNKLEIHIKKLLMLMIN